MPYGLMKGPKVPWSRVSFVTVLLRLSSDTLDVATTAPAFSRKQRIHIQTHT